MWNYGIKFNTYFWAVLIPSIKLKCHTDYLATNQYADVSCNFNLLLVCIVFPFTWACFIVQRWAKTSRSSWCLGVTKVGWDKMLTFVYITNTMFFWEVYSYALAAIFSNLFFNSNHVFFIRIREKQLRASYVLKYGNKVVGMSLKSKINL